MKQFKELNLDGYDFSNGLISSGVYRFEKLNILSMNIIEFFSHQNGNDWEQKIIPIEISKNDSDEVIDLLIY